MMEHDYIRYGIVVCALAIVFNYLNVGVIFACLLILGILLILVGLFVKIAKIPDKSPEKKSLVPKLIKKEYLIGFIWMFIIFLVLAAVGYLMINYSKYAGVLSNCLQILGILLICLGIPLFFIGVIVKLAKTPKKSPEHSYTLTFLPLELPPLSSHKSHYVFHPDPYAIGFGVFLIASIYLLPIFPHNYNHMTLSQVNTYCAHPLYSCSPVIPWAFYIIWLFGIFCILFGMFSKKYEKSVSNRQE